MDVIHARCAGLDVHKQTVVACVRVLLESGQVHAQIQTYGTATRELEGLRDWLRDKHVTHVAMESTGVYWKSIYNILEPHFALLLCNARHVKQVPGRKTDQKDCQWLASLLQYGLLRGSFVPPRFQRDLRDLTRHRAQVSVQHTRVANRIQKVLEDANIKLSSVATDILGASGRDMLRALIAGQDDPAALAELARRQLRGKIPQLRQALHGHVTAHHRFELDLLMDEIQFLEGQMARLDAHIEEIQASPEARAFSEATRTLPFAQAVALLDTVPGIDRVAAQAILAEIGTDMSRFPTPAHLASWAGMCPGNHESAGKRRSGRTTAGNRWLKAKLFQCAWAAARSKHTYLGAAYRRWAPRRGAKRAVVAVGHSMLVSIHRILHDGVAYLDLGPDYFDRLNPQAQVRYHPRRLQDLGYDVKIEPKTDVA